MPKISGKEKFNQFFFEVYQDRWVDLYKHLQIKEKQVLRKSFAYQESFEAESFEAQSFEIEWLPQCSWYEETMSELAHSINEQGLRRFYIMNPASVIAAKSLNIQTTDKVLDMCAAPGGKSLILLESLGDNGQLWANEISPGRRDKLIKVIKDYVPLNLRKNVFVKGKDGIKYGLNYPCEFDKILIDAPCSGERHILSKKEEVQRWSIKRTKRLAGIQYGLLCSGLLALKSGGELIYSTCSISPLENDEVIGKLIRKKSSMFEVDLPEKPTPWAEKTKYGYLHLPDRCGFGPIYFTRLKKL